MKKLIFDITINASSEKVWETLWADESYRKWTSAFTKGSYAVSDWQQGSQVLFLSPGGGGMVSKIAELRKNEFMSFEHLGVVKDGVEDTSSSATEGWAGAHENYTLKETNGFTNLVIEMEITEEFETMFADIWPKALQLLKDLAEG